MDALNEYNKAWREHVYAQAAHATALSRWVLAGQPTSGWAWDELCVCEAHVRQTEAARAAAKSAANLP